MLTEVATGERRVALSPDGARRLVDAGHVVAVENSAGARAGFPDEEYVAAGADVCSRSDVLSGGRVLLQVRGSGTHDTDDGVSAALGSDHILIGLVDPLWMSDNAVKLAATGASILSLELVPRITRAQSMDVLSSMATVSGYEATLLAATVAPRMFPLLMTAAGTIAPARVVVLGAGVAGLQAIATARRLGAVVQAYDVRPAAIEQIESIGAKAIELDMERGDSEDVGGYAKAQTDDQTSRQQTLLTPYLAEADVVITTAAIPGAASPELITTGMVEAMARGSVIIDLAAERGGNCRLTEPDSVVVHAGVSILGPTDLASRAPLNASQMLSNNIVSLLDHLTNTEGESTIVLDPEDEITAAMLVAQNGRVVHPRVLETIEQG